MAFELKDIFKVEYDDAEIDAFNHWKADSIDKTIYNAVSGGNLPGEQAVVNLLKINNSDAQIIAQIWEIFNPMAIALLVIFFLTELLDKAVNTNLREMDEKFFISMLLKFIVGIGLMQFGLQLIEMILGLGNGLYDQVQEITIAGAGSDEAGKQTAVDVDALVKYIHKMGIFSKIGTLIMAVIKGAISAGVSLIVAMNAFSKKLEIMLMAGFMGVGLSQYFSESGKNGAIRYIKKFVACVLHAVSMIIIMRMATLLATTVGNPSTDPKDLIDAMSSFTGIVCSFMFSFAAIGFMSGAKSVINDALGV